MHEAFDDNSCDHHGPSKSEIKEPDIKTSDHNHDEIEFLTFNSSSFVIAFDEKAFEDHLKATTSHLKDDWCFYFWSSLRIGSMIKDTHATLDSKKTNEIIHP